MKNLILTLTTCFLSILSFSQLNSTLLFHWNDTTIIGSAAYDNAYNECWGFEVNNTEIAVIGSTEGTHFFNVTDPQNSTEVAFVAGAYTGSGVVHRDYHDYQGYLYIVCDEGWSTSTLQIVDISNLPTSVNVVYDSDSLFNTSHNIFIDTATSKLYACASNSAMDIYSLDTPTLPNLIYSYTDVGHVHDAYVRNDTAYLNCGNDGFRIIDFHYLDLGGGMAWDELASFTSYPDAGYNHSGWLSDDGTIYAMQDENHGYDVKIIDVSDLNNITVLSTLNSGENAQSMAHNGIIKGDFLYLAYYHDGLRVFDISDPSNPIQICNYDTYSPSSYNSYKGAWGVYPYLPSGNIIVSDMQSGLYVLDCTVPVNSVKNINQNLNIYPNPAKDYFNVNKKANRIEIYDISGRKITQKIIEIEHKFYREDIVNGLYIYRLFNKRDLEIENGKIIFE
ncbi:MAG: choice-of-anchor B family protein [Flavobacteriales bacterium]|nr:choice-of-anchor B family protein [Flavobacteriales bacterium]